MNNLNKVQKEIDKLIQNSIIDDVIQNIKSGYDIPEDIQDLMILFNINIEDIQSLCEGI